ncbi:TIGR00341 family protein [Thiomicrorhabdus sp. zzn3]|uniref:TIGR00341 family protein n=1 Tax=Thiomicrorhabdus sp. zzn3 TaxID=3039775 RepID=UPI002436E470|nr:TIGR00341 family protein [Thiomicrorhabdus sp. zzn3]MDG6778748.1 TIGR00341 family protein [Thiomicrorhabdus sp. zzn3]
MLDNNKRVEAGMADWMVLYDAAKAEQFENEVKPLLQDRPCRFEAYDRNDRPSFEADSRVITWLDDESLYDLLPYASKQAWSVGLLPHPGLIRGMRSFFVAKKIEEAIEAIFSSEVPTLADLMYCNDRLVLGSVMLGNPVTMKPAAQVDAGFWSKLKHLMVMTSNLSKTCLLPYKLTTAKETTVSTAALGITVVYRPSGSDFTKRVVGEVLEDESTLNAVILAPRSISEVMHFILTRVLPKKVEVKALNDYLGHIKSEYLLISGSQQLDYSIDGEMMQADRLSIRVDENALQIWNPLMPQKGIEKEHKESVRVSGLPKGGAVNELINRPLPWIHHADQEEVKETFVTLKENAQASESYLVLMVLATLLATVGLFANSAPVIIGAMILAPLMAPIISLSMGVLRQNGDLIQASGRTLVTGIGLALLFGTLLTWITPLHTLNHEISARLSPTLLDLGVAIISGIAGAYANARSEVAKSLAGVAIAVALVPPLAVSGIGIGWFDWTVFSGAFLLFLTNLVGIVLAAAATFLVMGFSPFHLAKKGLLLSSAFVAVVSVPLLFAFTSMVKEQKAIYALEGWEYQGIEVREVKIRSGKPMQVSVKLITQRPLKTEQIDAIKQKMEMRLGEPIRLEASTAILRE